MVTKNAGAPAQATYLLLSVSAAAAVAPFLLSVLTAVKSPAEFTASSPLSAPISPTWDNFIEVITGPMGFGAAIGNTTLAAAVLVATQVPLSIMAAYAFATGRFAGRDFLFGTFVATLLIPPTALIVPLYFMVSQAGLAGTFAALIVPYVLGSPFAIFLLRQHFAAIPRDTIDAARIDGASEWMILWRIAVPLCRPTIAVVIFITVVTQWNSFIWPRVVGGLDWQTVAVATAAVQSQYRGNWTVVMAAATLATIPLLTLFAVLQGQITKSLVLMEA